MKSVCFAMYMCRFGAVLIFLLLARQGDVAADVMAVPMAGQSEIAAFYLEPTAHFDPSNVPPVPDYSRDDAWLALPSREDKADFTPQGVTDNQATAQVDVFFIHPTTYIYPETRGWNAPYDIDGAPRTMLTDGVLRGQASAFNGCCRVYAPNYRQAVVYAFMSQDRDGVLALDLAYQDVRAAFNYYLAHENNGRPFIIASHSQGSLHAERLAYEIRNLNLTKRLVAVYSIGSSMPEEITEEGIPICDAPDQTGCILNYNSVTSKADMSFRKNNSVMFLKGKYELAHGRPIACVNPLTWRRNGAGDASWNAGSLSDLETGVLEHHAVGAECRDHMLVISFAPGTTGFRLSGPRNSGDFHIYDYGLFYMNIRENAQARVAAYFAKHGAKHSSSQK